LGTWAHLALNFTAEGVIILLQTRPPHDCVCVCGKPFTLAGSRNTVFFTYGCHGFQRQFTFGKILEPGLFRLLKNNMLFLYSLSQPQYFQNSSYLMLSSWCHHQIHKGRAQSHMTAPTSDVKFKSGCHCLAVNQTFPPAAPHF
jgi:hypothetical protein